MSGADRYLDGHYAELRDRFAGEAPRWMPEALYRRVFDRLYARLRERLVAMAADPDDETRQQFERWIAGLPDRLETSPELRERGEQLKREVLGSAGLRDWSSSLWQKAKDTLRTQAADPESELRRRLADVLVATGGRLGSDPRLQEGLERLVESGARALAVQFHDELADLVTGTIERWDAAETSTPAGTAPRARSAVHPHQRDGGGGRRGTGLARHRPGSGLMEVGQRGMGRGDRARWGLWTIALWDVVAARCRASAWGP